MVTHYIYVLHYRNVPFYIGISIDPKKRLHDHFGTNAGVAIKYFVKKIKSIKEVSIIILGTVKTNSAIKCKKCVLAEQIWINKYLNEGHKLKNQLIKNIP